VLVVAVLSVLPAADVGAARLPYSRTLLVVGDSLTVGTQPYIGHFLRGWRVRHDVSISKQVTEGPGDLKRWGRRLPRVIFVNLGTNGDPRAVGTFLTSLRRVMKIAGPNRCVVWASIVRPPVGGASYHAMNRTLANQARKRRNLIMFRWVRMARAHPYWFGGDHVHVTATAYRTRARAMAVQIRHCRDEVLRHSRPA
jgi:hypothetical protein